MSIESSQISGDRWNFERIKRTVDDYRSSREQSVEDGVELKGGGFFDTFKSLGDYLDDVLDEMYRGKVGPNAEVDEFDPSLGEIELGGYGEYFEDKVMEIGNGFFPDNMDYSEVYKKFKKSLTVAFKQEFIRLGQKYDQDEVTRIMSNKNYIRKFAVGYGFDFFRSLRRSKKRRVSPGNAMDLACLTNRYGPYILPNLEKKYLEDGEKNKDNIFNRTVILRALLKHRSDPEGWLDNLPGTIKKLSQDFSEFSPSWIKHVVLMYKEPEEFLVKARDRFNRLLSDFPELNDKRSLIERAVFTNIKDPEGFLRDEDGWSGKYKA